LGASWPIVGSRDARIVEEAREHLVDSMEDGLKRGLSLEAAEREAFVRFGALETVAAHVDAERHCMTKWKDSFAGSLGTVWRRKWSFVSSNSREALQVTERLASLFIEENLRDREVRAEGTIAFIDAQIQDVRRQIISYENTLETLRAQNGGRRLSQADLLPYEVLQETYRALLTKSQESRIAANFERRQIGEQFRIVDPARLSERPVGPSRFGVNVIGGLAGLGLALAFVGVSSVRQPRPERKSDTAGV